MFTHIVLRSTAFKTSLSLVGMTGWLVYRIVIFFNFFPKLWKDYVLIKKLDIS